MTVWLVTRHAGALEWLSRQGFAGARHVRHLHPADVKSGDTVVGTLPVWMVAELNSRGARYLHLTVPMAASYRGRELTTAELQRLGARLEAYEVCRPNFSWEPDQTGKLAGSGESGDEE